MVRNPYKQLLTPDEARRAIYIDFEGRKNEPPVLLGSLYFEGRRTPDPERLVFRHDIVDPTLAPLADAVEITGLHLYRCEARSVATAIRDLVRRANNQKRPIVAWSQHEITRIQEADLSDDLEAVVQRWFRNGKETATKWRTTRHPDWQLERDAAGRVDRLTHYLDRIGYHVPPDHRGGRVGETIKSLRTSLERGKDWEDLRETQRDRWAALLMHNYHDCNGMRTVVQRAADELAASHTGN